MQSSIRTFVFVGFIILLLGVFSISSVIAQAPQRTLSNFFASWWNQFRVEFVSGGRASLQVAVVQGAPAPLALAVQSPSPIPSRSPLVTTGTIQVSVFENTSVCRLQRSNCIGVQSTTINFYQTGVLILSRQAIDGTLTVSGLAPGSYVLEAVAQGYYTSRLSAIVRANRTVAVTFYLTKLPPPGNAEITVRDKGVRCPSGNPGCNIIFTAIVTLYQSGNIVGLDDTRDGVATFTNLVPGTYQAEVVALGYNVYRLSVGITSSRTRTYTAYLTRSSTPLPSPSPTLRPTPTPSPISSPSPTPSLTMLPTSSPVVSLTPTPTISPTVPPSPSPSVSPTPVPISSGVITISVTDRNLVCAPGATSCTTLHTATVYFFNDQNALVGTDNTQKGFAQLSNVPVGTYTAIIQASGYLPKKLEVQLGTTSVSSWREVELNPQEQERYGMRENFLASIYDAFLRVGERIAYLLGL